MKKNLLIIFIGLCFISCKKDRLEEEKKMLIGKWRWTHSVKEYYVFQGKETLTPQTENTTYSIEFIEKGRIKLVKNGKVIENGRIILKYWESGCHPLIGGYLFDIHINNNDKKRLAGCINKDTLVTHAYFPYTRVNERGKQIDYQNYFVRE